MRTEAEMRAEDADPSGQKAVDALVEAERHANGAARMLMQDLRPELTHMFAGADGDRIEDMYAAIHAAIRQCERQVLMARGFLTHPAGALNHMPTLPLIRRLAPKDEVRDGYTGNCVYCGSQLPDEHKVDCAWAEARRLLGSPSA